MKRYLLFLVALVLVVAVGCDQQQNPTSPENSVRQNPVVKFGVNQKINLATIKAKMEAVKAKVTPLLAEHRALLAAKQAPNETAPNGASPAAVTATRVVPSILYPTIQSAVDAASPGDKITVKASGSPYTEIVVVSTPNLKISASGSVTVAGGFGIDTGVNGVTIEKFNIDGLSSQFGIYAFENSGGKIKDNTVSNAFLGIILDGSTDYTVEDNICHDNFIGIAVGFFIFGGQPSNGNDIEENDCSKNLGGIVVGFSSGNEFKKNVCSSNFQIGLGVFESNNNEFEKNVCNNNTGPGIVVTGVSSGNKIQSGNIAQKNSDHGLILDVDTFNNKIKENTFTKNTPCDILDDGTGNVFSKNKFGCKTP